MPNPAPVTPTSTTPANSQNSGVSQAQPGLKEAPINEPGAKKNETPGINSANPSVSAEKGAVNQGETAIRKLKLKVDGREEELPEHEVIARAQKATASERRFAEAQQTKASAEAFIQMLRDPQQFFKLLDDPKLGLDEKAKRAALEQYYKQKYIDPEVLTPEERARQAEQEELNRYREGEKLTKKQQQEERERMVEQHHAENYQKLIINALQTEGLPKTEFTARRMVDLMSKNVQLGLELTPEHLATLVRQDYMEEQRALYSATDGDTLLSLMGDDIVNKIRKADLARLRAGLPKVPAPTVETPHSNAPQTPRKAMSMDEMREERDRKTRELQAAWKK